MDGYVYIRNKIMRVPCWGTLYLEDNAYKESIIKAIKEMISIHYFDEYGFEIFFIDNMKKIKKEPFFNNRFRIRFPNIDTQGKLEFLINNPELYDFNLELELRRINEREYIEESQ